MARWKARKMLRDASNLQFLANAAQLMSVTGTIGGMTERELSTNTLGSTNTLIASKMKYAARVPSNCWYDCY